MARFAGLAVLAALYRTCSQMSAEMEVAGRVPMVKVGSLSAGRNQSEVLVGASSSQELERPPCKMKAHSRTLRGTPAETSLNL